MTLQIILLHNTLTKKELKSFVQSFAFFHQMIVLKFQLSPFTKNLCYLLIETTLKMMNNIFYFILKALFVLKVFKFLSMFKFSVMQENRLD